jgi:hypothetical protein
MPCSKSCTRKGSPAQLQGQPLVAYANSLGISLANLPYQGIYGPGSAPWESKNTPEIQRRVLEVERHLHDMATSNCITILAAASAFASIVGASIAAWAILRRRD